MFTTRQLRNWLQGLDTAQVCERLETHFDLHRSGQTGGFAPKDVSIKALFEATVPDGAEAIRYYDPREAGFRVTEAIEAIDSTTFLSAASVLISAAVLDAYERGPYQFSNRVPTIPTRLESEYMEGIYNLGDVAREVHEGMPYPQAGVTGQTIETPKTVKHGLIIALTKEALFFDRTGQLLERARQVGETLRLKLENAIIDLIIGKTNNYNWNGTAYNTYQATTPWINTINLAAAELIDWTDIDQAEALFMAMTDPQGEPIEIGAKQLITNPSKTHTVRQIFGANEVETVTGSATIVSKGPSTLVDYETIFSQRLYARLISQNAVTADQAKATWFLGDLAKFMAVNENWPLTVVQAPPNSEAEFNQDIVTRFKASAKRIPFVREPRAMVRVLGYAP